MKKNTVSEIMERMKAQRMNKPLVVTKTKAVGNSYSGFVKPLNTVTKKAPSAGGARMPPPTCDKYLKKGAGAAAMTLPELVDFIKKKAPRPVFEKFSRLQKKTRPEICKILAEFEEGYRLLYPKDVAVPVPTNTPPAANNLTGMFNLAERLQRNQVKKTVDKAVKTYESGVLTMENFNFTPTNGNALPNTPNFENYGNVNNFPNNTEARVRERNVYLRRLAEKRVERDPLAGTMSAANIKRFDLKPLKNYAKAKTIKRSVSEKPALMKFNDGNMRAPTNVTKGLVVSTSPVTNAAMMRIIREEASKKMNALQKKMNNLKKQNKLTVAQKYRMRLIEKMLDDPIVMNRIVRRTKDAMTMPQRLGLQSPPKPKSPPPKSFTMSRLVTNKPLTNRQLNMLNRLVKGKKQNNVKVDVSAIKDVMNRYLKSTNISKYKIDKQPCMQYTKPKLVKVARLVTNGQIKNLNSMTKENLCRLIKISRGSK